MFIQNVRKHSETLSRFKVCVFFMFLLVDGSTDDESCSDVARPLKCRILASELGRGAIASSGVTTRSKTWSFEKVGSSTW